MDDITSLEQLLNGNTTTSTVTTDITSTITQIIAWIVIPSILFAILFLVLFIIYFIRRRKLENAIFEIRDILRDMQQSQKPSHSNSPTPATVSNTSDTQEPTLEI